MKQPVDEKTLNLVHTHAIPSIDLRKILQTLGGATTALLRGLAIVTALLSLGLGPSLVQSVGWVNMLQNHWLETGSISQAVENTFNGQHPCSFCEIAADLAQTQSSATDAGEQKPPLEQKGKSLKDLSAGQYERIAVYPPIYSLSLHIQRDEFPFFSTAREPESPPPRDI